ncbi:MAG: hypothetical protein PWQ10_444 [Patescibacteria group bacterium]|nr:hypothetical protein [Patescibacteria group bacterium]
MKSVVLCGSRRFKTEIREFANELKKQNIDVFEPILHQGHEEWTNLSDDYKKYIALGLTHGHFAKIRMADVVYVYNKDSYSGVSTTLEIGYAVALDKPIYAFSNDNDEICRQILFREIITSPKDLIKKL